MFTILYCNAALKVGGDLTTVISNSEGNNMYKAPERKTGATISNKVDVYSLGIVLAELLHLFKTATEWVRVIPKLMKHDLPTEWNDEPFKGLLLKCLAQDPNNRPSVLEMLVEVEGQK